MHACCSGNLKRRRHEFEKKYSKLEVKSGEIEMIHKLDELHNYVRKRILNDVL